MRKKNKNLMIILAVTAVICLIGVAIMIGYDHVDHSNLLSDKDTALYNSAITASGRAYGSLRSDEFVLIETVSKQLGDDTVVTFRVYKLPEGAKFADYQDLKVSDLPADFAPEYMGSGTARLLGGALEKAVVSVTYYK